ncbi:MAG: hypothetical protein ACJ8M4_00830 [Chthoniobacterales bacterium]
MTKLFCGILALALTTAVAANAGEPPTFEVRKRDSVGELSVVRVPLTVAPELEGHVLLSFEAPEPGAYAFIYMSGPDKGKLAKVVEVEKPGKVEAEVPVRAQKN